MTARRDGSVDIYGTTAGAYVKESIASCGFKKPLWSEVDVQVASRNDCPLIAEQAVRCRVAIIHAVYRR